MDCCDATFLSLLFHDKCPTPDGVDGKPVQAAKERVQYLVKRLNKEKAVIVIPTPALSELLTIVETKVIPTILKELEKSTRFRIESFDTKAAVEAALLTRDAIAEGKAKKDSLQSNWSKIKFDRQIVAIAKASGCDTLYSDDSDMEIHCKRAKLELVRTADLPVPPEAIPPPLIAEIERVKAAEKNS